ncbi:MAG: helix-turn-helix domain-containing protein [Treponema sp.]|nr:helix-turn-helix domain-containing protein [Treponema sp.]
MKDYLEDFRMNMKYYREKNDVSQTQLAIICDCGTGTIGGIESGKAKPSFDMIVRIADALKVTPADLFIRNSSKDKIEIKKQLKTQFEQILEKL